MLRKWKLISSMPDLVIHNHVLLGLPGGWLQSFSNSWICERRIRMLSVEAYHGHSQGCGVLNVQSSSTYPQSRVSLQKRLLLRIRAKTQIPGDFDSLRLHLQLHTPGHSYAPVCRLFMILLPGEMLPVWTPVPKINHFCSCNLNVSFMVDWSWYPVTVKTLR